MDDASIIGVNDLGTGRDVELGRKTTSWCNSSVGACGNGNRKLCVNEGLASSRDRLHFGAVEIVSGGSGGSSSQNPCGI